MWVACEGGTWMGINKAPVWEVRAVSGCRVEAERVRAALLAAFQLSWCACAAPFPRTMTRVGADCI